MAEQMEIMARSFGDEPFSFQGEHYVIEDLDARPKPVQRPRPPIIVGGRGGRRSLALAARWADEYNTFSASVDEIRERRAAFATSWADAGRNPETLRFSVMVTVLVGTDEAELRDRVARLADWQGSEPAQVLDSLRATGVVGTVDQAAEQLRELEAAGAQRVMVQHLLHDDLDAVDLIGRELIPRVA
jgi:alkanesulfonate monooxygenase SsuD/methylene tetrahydromethanopterin reductase-like flavin-dependent oxidoreductase (luciferase family)